MCHQPFFFFFFFFLIGKTSIVLIAPTEVQKSIHNVYKDAKKAKHEYGNEPSFYINVK